MSKPSPIKVMHLIDSLSLGGAQGILQFLTQFHPKDQVEHRVFALHGKGEMAERVRKNQVFVSSIANSKKNPLLPILLLKRVWKEKPDILHTHLVASSYLAEVLRPYMPKGLKVVASVQNAYRRHDDYGYQNFLERFAYHHSDAVIACSRFVEKTIRDERPRQRRLVVIRNAIDDGLFTGRNLADRAEIRKELNLHDNTVVFFSPSRLSKQKNLKYALEVIAELRRDHPLLVYLIAGTGPLEKELKQFVRDRGLVDVVRFLGFRKDVARIFAAADFLMMPSLYEGLSLTMVEAMAKESLPVITPFPAGTEVVSDGKTGIVIPFDEPVHSAKILTRAISDEKKLKKIGKNAFRYAERNLKASLMAERYLKVYRKLSQDSAGSSK